MTPSSFSLKSRAHSIEPISNRFVTTFATTRYNSQDDTRAENWIVNVLLQGIGQIVGMLVNFRHQLRNDQKLKVARSLLRVSWSLTFSTISDLVNALHPHRNPHCDGPDLYTVDELELFCQESDRTRFFFRQWRPWVIFLTLMAPLSRYTFLQPSYVIQGMWHV